MAEAATDAGAVVLQIMQLGAEEVLAVPHTVVKVDHDGLGSADGLDEEPSESQGAVRETDLDSTGLVS